MCCTDAILSLQKVDGDAQELNLWPGSFAGIVDADATLHLHAGAIIEEIADVVKCFDLLSGKSRTLLARAFPRRRLWKAQHRECHKNAR